MKNDVCKDTYLGDYVGKIIARDPDTVTTYGAELFGKLDVDAGPMGSALRYINSHHKVKVDGQPAQANCGDGESHWNQWSSKVGGVFHM